MKLLCIHYPDSLLYTRENILYHRQSISRRVSLDDTFHNGRSVLSGPDLALSSRSIYRRVSRERLQIFGAV